ncbi:MAG TPA: hypothetical protein VD969_19240 [Symbiobacteriaceae bacterium]|nr:hypothetical protein [Symbiobacteriaceae bacterium]
MSLKRKIGIAAGAVVLAGSLLAGAAFANEARAATPAAPGVLVKQSALSEGAKAVLTQMRELRKAAMEKLKADSKGIIDQAVAEGKITQEEADKLLERGGRGFVRKFRGGNGDFKGIPEGRFHGGLKGE